MIGPGGGHVTQAGPMGDLPGTFPQESGGDSPILAHTQQRHLHTHCQGCRAGDMARNGAGPDPGPRHGLS